MLTIVLMWLIWFVVLIGFQKLVTSRFKLDRPDKVLSWTPSDTGRHYAKSEPTLTDPFLNTQVSFDSEYYLSIATVGYDDPLPGALEPADGSKPIPLNYAFFPLYPTLIRGLALGLRPLALTPVATATLAGVIISLLGTLAALFALYDMTLEQLGADGAIRTAFYLLIFPTGYFLAQVYTEGLFLGLTFVSLALMRRKQLGPASLLTLLAIATRGVGVALVVPLAWVWLTEFWQKQGPRFPVWRQALWVLLPVLVYGAWHFSAWGRMFTTVEEFYFGRQFLAVGRSWESVVRAFNTIVQEGWTQTAVYYALELSAVTLGLITSLFTWRRYPELTLFSLVVLLIPLTSGDLQSMQRYVLTMPSIFVVLSQWGKNAHFDRAWTLTSILMMGFLVTLYSFDFWTA